MCEPMDMREAQHYRVHAGFAGERAGSGPLTWGQRGMWTATQRNPPGHFNIPMVLATPRRPPATVRAVAAAIGQAVSRHESLRTRIVVDGGQPGQQSRAGRPPPVDVVDVAGADEVAAATAELRDRLSGAAFGYPEEWPLRVGLVANDRGCTTTGDHSR